MSTEEEAVAVVVQDALDAYDALTEGQAGVRWKPSPRGVSPNTVLVEYSQKVYTLTIEEGRS